MKNLKHVSLFESFDGETPNVPQGHPNHMESEAGQYATCISSEGGWSAVGILSADQEMYVKELQDMYPEEITVEKIPADEEGSFIVLDGEENRFVLFKEGDVYRSNDGFVFPIISDKMFVALANGHTVDFDIVDPSKLKDL